MADRSPTTDGAHDTPPIAARRVDRDAHGGHVDAEPGLRARQRERFGGLHALPAILGWLVALGISVLLAAILAAAGAAIGLTDGGTTVSDSEADTIGIAGGVLLVLVFALAYYTGGYAAGRMARFDGVRHAVATWVLGILVTVVLGALGAIAGSEYNVFSQLDLPSIPLSGSSLTTGGAIAGIAVLVISLLAAILGGRAGERFHRRIDRAGV